MTSRDKFAKAAALMGKKGGSSTSEAKVKAAKGNGKKGGRPKTEQMKTVIN